MNPQAIFTIILLILTLAVLTSQRLRADVTAVVVVMGVAAVMSAFLVGLLVVAILLPHFYLANHHFDGDVCLCFVTSRGILNTSNRKTR